jgi:hypothetical protein
MSDEYQAEIAFLGMESSSSFVRQTECSRCVERFIRTLQRPGYVTPAQAPEQFLALGAGA